jgi:two-component system, cell cycle sensor histidine kinase and response regulator CckA
MDNALKLFLLEDDPEVALLMRRRLEQAGHQVTVCGNATDALIVLGHAPFDLILLDQLLKPRGGERKIDGLELLHLLMKEGVTVPVVMVTGAGSQQLAAEVLRAGALDYIVKDSNFLEELPKRVAESVTRHRLEQMNQLLVQSLESARDGIMITDLQGTILKVNQALEKMTGYSRQELLGKTPEVLKTGGPEGEGSGPVWRTILARNSWQGELTNRRKNGSLYQTSVTISPVVDQRGRLTHFVAIERDVTAHKHLERQLLQAQKMQSIGTLAGGVAHEFNNLLAGINGYAYLGLREPGLGEPLREFLQNIVDLSERAASLTRQLLAFARKPTLSRQRQPITDLVRGTAELIKRTLHKDVAVELPPQSADDPLLVEADANQLQQAIVNLVLNARDAVNHRAAPVAEEPAAAAEEQPPIAIRLRHVVLQAEQVAFPQQVPPGDYVVLEVEDRGIGMSPQVLSQALDPFFTTKDVGQGTGLGLPMVFGIVQGHQGFLTIDSAVGRGTRVSLYLPRLVQAATAPKPGAAPYDAEVVEPESTPGQTILVIDDEEAVLDVVRRFLEIAGHRVICATSGRQALDLLTDDVEVDLVVLDLMMPREDAPTNFNNLRQRRPGIPVLLCTGLPQADPAPELLRRGAIGLLRKPFRMNELWYAVKQGLSAAVVRSEPEA